MHAAQERLHLFGGDLMPPRARTAIAGPEFMTSPTLGELIAAELEALANPEPPPAHDGGEFGHQPGGPALTPTERARRSMLMRAATEIRTHHEPVDAGEA